MGTFVSSNSLESGIVPKFPKVSTADCLKTFMDIKVWVGLIRVLIVFTATAPGVDPVSIVRNSKLPPGITL